jgi:hypothetical protein
MAFSFLGASGLALAMDMMHPDWIGRESERARLNGNSKKSASMTKKLVAVLLTPVLFAGTVAGRAKEVKTVTIRIDGFMKSKSGAI